MKVRALILPLLLALIMGVPWGAGLGERGSVAAAQADGQEAAAQGDTGTPDGSGDEADPTAEPTATETPTESPTAVPTETPVATPTEAPTEAPSQAPDAPPTVTPEEPSPTATETPAGTPAATPSEPAFAAAAAEDLLVTLNCRSNPEMTRIDNLGDVPVTIVSVSTLLDANAAEPYVVNRTLGAGRTVIYRSGPGAVSGTILTADTLYTDAAYDADGVVIETTDFDLEVRCAAAPPPSASDVKITLTCAGNPELTRIDNLGALPLVISSVGSLKDPGGNEPVAVNRTLGAGKTVIYRSGSGATSGTILTTSFLYDDAAGDAEGVRLVTNAGIIEKRCAPTVYPSQLTVTLSCNTSPEKITIKNVGQGPVRLASLRTSYEPIAAEPFGLTATLNPNQTIVYQSGTGATANVLTSQNILNQNVGTQERVTVTVSTSKTFSVTCPAVPSGERWIDINLTTQYLTAYQGGTAVNGYYISSGRYPQFETPTGTFYINTKLLSQTMAGCLQGECYNVPNVPHVMYFTNVGHALHGAYWHNNFGQRMSHGCINEPLDQAEWLYNWSSIGTRVVIHSQAADGGRRTDKEAATHFRVAAVVFSGVRVGDSSWGRNGEIVSGDGRRPTLVGRRGGRQGMLNFPTIPHFEMREAQRGYRREQIAYVLEFGTVYRRAGAIFFVLLRRDIPDGDRRRDDVWRLAGTVVVVEGGVVKTVYRNADPVRHVERKAKYCAKRGKATAHEFGQGEESDAGRGFIAA